MLSLIGRAVVASLLVASCGKDVYDHPTTVAGHEDLARHYEAIVIAASLEHAVGGLPAALPIPDAIVCARVGHTRIADVQAALDGLRASGGAAVGIVLWDAPPPDLPTPARIARAQRPLNTPVMQSLSPSR